MVSRVSTGRTKVYACGMSNQRGSEKMGHGTTLLVMALIFGGVFQIGVGTYTGNTDLRWFLIGFGLCGILGGIKIAKLS